MQRMPLNGPAETGSDWDSEAARPRFTLGSQAQVKLAAKDSAAAMCQSDPLLRATTAFPFTGRPFSKIIDDQKRCNLKLYHANEISFSRLEDRSHLETKKLPWLPTQLQSFWTQWSTFIQLCGFRETGPRVYSLVPVTATLYSQPCFLLSPSKPCFLKISPKPDPSPNPLITDFPPSFGKASHNCSDLCSPSL